MKSSRAQTSNEYLTMLAVILIIAVISIGIYEIYNKISSKANTDSDKVNYKTDELGIEDYYFGATYSLIKIKNNAPQDIQVTAIRFNDNDSLMCTSLNSKLPIKLALGKSTVVRCAIGKDKYSVPESLVPIISVRYLDANTGAAYTSGTGQFISAQAGEVVDNCTKYGNCPRPYSCNDAGIFHNGSGTLGSPYGICNWVHLNNVRNYSSSYFILLTDLDSSSSYYSGIGDNWNPIGNQSGNQFSGKFNGNNNAISNLRISKTSDTNVGFFGYSSGDVYNLGLVDIIVNGATNVGGLVGYQAGGSISRSYLDGNIYGTGNNIGGLVGYLSTGSITDCYTMGSLSAS